MRNPSAPIQEELDRLKKVAKGPILAMLEGFDRRWNEDADQVDWIIIDDHLHKGHEWYSILSQEISPQFFLRHPGGVVVFGRDEDLPEVSLFEVIVQHSSLIFLKSQQDISWENTINLSNTQAPLPEVLLSLDQAGEVTRFAQRAKAIYLAKDLYEKMGLALQNEREDHKAQYIQIKANSEQEGFQIGSDQSVLRQFAELVRRQKDRFRQQMKNIFQEYTRADHPFRKEWMTLIDNIHVLDEKKGSKQNLHTIPEKYKTGLNENIQKGMRQLFDQLSDHYTYGLDYLSKKGNEVLNNLGLVGQEYNFSRPSYHDFEQILARYLADQRGFEVTSANRGLMEYFMGARIYYMFLIMGLSMMGLSGFFMKYRIFLTPLSIVLFGFGGYQIWANKQREKSELEKKNVDAARSFIKSENERVISEGHRTIEKTFTDDFVTSSDGLYNMVEEEAQKVLRGSHKGHEQKNKVLQQSILKSLQEDERYFTDLERGLEGGNKTLQRLARDLKIEVEKFFHQISRSHERRD